jgi:isochorismate hydrolase
MKETYFNPETIGPLSSHWLELFGVKRKRQNQPFRIDSAALLILDMQEYFLDPNSHAYIPSGEAIIPNLNQAVSFFRQAERPVWATRHANTAENARRMSSWWSELLSNDHPLGGLHPDLSVEPTETIQKAQYDAFYGSVLQEKLSEANVEQLVIGGVMTHLCCETTARAAFVLGYEVFFLIDGTATYNEDFHKGTLRNLAHGFSVLTTVEHLLGEES